MKVVKISKGLFLLFIGILFMGLQAKAQIKEKTANKPQENISVNKSYDEAGNLIRYDSTYTWHYSSAGDDSIIIQNFYDGFPSFLNQNMGTFPFSDFSRMDSVFMKDFFSEDYFENSFLRQDDHLREFMQQLDSLKENFISQPHAFEEDIKL